MKKSSKKGFTVVELVIVIAVIGVLAAVLIPAFLNLTRKANIASDESLVKTLNTALAMKENEIGDTVNKNPSDMVEDLKYEGYDLETLLKRQKSDKNIIYNLPKNRFLFEENKGTANFIGSKPHDFWEFKKTATFNIEGYSLYLMEEYEGADITNLITGLDTGKNDEDFDVSYVASDDKTAIIRTNNGTLTINASQATVHHYGNAEVLVINSIKGDSYHEFGTINNAQIKTGHIVIENQNASIDKLLLIAKSEEEGFDKIKIAIKQGASLPELDRTKVNIGVNGTKVCDVTIENNTNAIWLYSNGIYENIKITDSSATSVNASSEPAPAKTTPLGKASFEIANAALRNDEDELVDDSGNPVSVEQAVITEKDTPTEEEIDIGTTSFSGGLGTLSNPYLISRVSQFENITGDLIDKNYLLTKDFNIKNEDFGNKLYLIDELTGSLDGGNFRIKFPHLPTDDKHTFINKLNGTLKNIEIEFDNYGSVVAVSDVEATFTNVDVYGEINAIKNYGAYLTTDEAPQVTFNNCDFYGVIQAGGDKNNYNAIYIGFFDGLSDSDPQERRASFNNCRNYGSVISGCSALFFAGGRKTNDIGTRAYVTLDINNCANNGVIEWVDTTFYRPYNHFSATNIQELKEINIDGIKYIKTVNMTEEQKEAAGINGTTVKEMEQINSQHPTSLWSGTRLYKHTAPTMPDANGRNYLVSTPDASLALYLVDDGSFRIYKASSEVSYYEVTNKTYVHYNGASLVYTISETVNANQFVDGKYTTVMKNYSFVDANWINDVNHPERQGGEFGVITINGVDYKTYTINDEVKYFYDDEGSGFHFASDLYRNRPGTVYVSAYDSNGKVLSSSKLSLDPEPVEELPDWYVAYNPSTMTNLVETGVASNNVSVLFNPDNPSALVQGMYVSTARGSGPYYETTTESSLDYLSGCIKIENVTNDTYIFIRTKSLMNNDHDRIFFGSATGNNSPYHFGGSKVVRKINTSTTLNFDEYVDGEYHVYHINLNDFYVSAIRGTSDPATLEDLADGCNLYIRLSVYGEGCDDTIIYRA